MIRQMFYRWIGYVFFWVGVKAHTLAGRLFLRGDDVAAYIEVVKLYSHGNINSVGELERTIALNRKMRGASEEPA